MHSNAKLLKKSLMIDIFHFDNLKNNFFFKYGDLLHLDVQTYTLNSFFQGAFLKKRIKRYKSFGLVNNLY